MEPGAIAEERMSRTPDCNDVDRPVMVVLDAQGDILVELTNITLLSSSKILCMASPYFAKLLQPLVFAEGQRPPSQTTPQSTPLDFEDAEAVSLVCKILHFRGVEAPVDVESLAAVTDVCDYLMCQDAVRYHVIHWLHAWKDQQSLQAEELIRLLYVCYVFDIVDAFSTYSGRLATITTQRNLLSLNIDPLSERIRDAISKIRSNVLISINRATDKSLKHLMQAQDGQHYQCQGYLVCNVCQRRKPRMTKKCGSCGSHDLDPEYCHAATRVRWFLGWLENRDIWPVTDRMSRSGQSFLKALEGDSPTLNPLTNWWAHDCECGQLCPLEVAKKSLEKNVKTLLRDSPGLNLREFKQTTSSLQDCTK